MLMQGGQLGVAAVHIILGVLVLRAPSAGIVNRAFAAQSFVFAGWILGLSGLHNSTTVALAFSIAFAFASFIPVAFVMFSHCYPAADTWSSPSYLRVVFVIGSIFAVLSLGTDSIIYDAAIGPGGLTRRSGPLYPAFCAFFLITWCVGLWIFVKKWRASRGLARAQYHYLGAGLVGGSLGGISTNLLVPMFTGHSTYSWMGPYFSLVYVGFIAHAIIRHRLMDLRVFIHRGLTISAAILVSAVPMGALLALFWPRLSVQLNSLEVGLLLAAVAVVTILIPVTRDLAGRILDRYVYRTHADYQRTLRAASQVLTRVLHLDRLVAFIATTVVQSTGAAGVAIYLREDGRFRRVIANAPLDVGQFAAPPEPADAVVAALETAQEPILADELPRTRHDTAIALHKELIAPDWSLLLPVRSEDTLVAIIAVGPKLSGDSYYQQDLDLLMTLANQAAVALKNAQLYAAVVLTNEYLENIVATLESGVIAINAMGQIAIFNRAAEELTGLPASTARGRMATVLDNPITARLLRALVDGQAHTDPELELSTGGVADTEKITRPVICTTSPVRDLSGLVVGAVAVFSDLTPLKQLQVERRNAERLAYFQALASAIAHEIKNPLVAIKTFAQLLPRRREDGRFLDEFGRISVREIERMHRLVDRLRTLSHPTDGPRSPIDLRGPLSHALEVMQPMFDEKRIHLVPRLGDTPSSVIGNAAELQQVFLNLLLNAHEATPADGTVTVEMAFTVTSVAVTVSDSGPGIAPEVLDRVFEPFFTTKSRGSGLGLAISSAIAQIHGARLRAENLPTGGARFSLEFPATTTTSSVVA